MTQINSRAPAPDLTLFLEVPPDLALRRRRAEQPEAELFEKLPLQRRIAANYRRAIARGGEGGLGGAVEVLDGTRTIGAVADEIERTIVKRFKLESAGPPYGKWTVAAHSVATVDQIRYTPVVH